MIVRDYDSKNVLKDLIRVLERASFETCAFIEIRLELREINELLTELYKIPNANMVAPSVDIVRCDECQYYEDGHCESAEMWQSISGYITECGDMSRNADDFCSYGNRKK